jgi:hypothetical protein
MNIVLWFLLGLIVAAGISAGALHLFRLRSKSEGPLPAENLPKDWESVMPREKSNSRKPESKRDEPSFKKVGHSKSDSGSRGQRKLK